MKQLITLVLIVACTAGAVYGVRQSGTAEAAWKYCFSSTDVESLVDWIVEYEPRDGDDREVARYREEIRGERYWHAWRIVKCGEEWKLRECYALRKIAIRKAEIAAKKSCRCGPDCKCGDGANCHCESKTETKVK